MPGNRIAVAGCAAMLMTIAGGTGAAQAGPDSSGDVAIGFVLDRGRIVEGLDLPGNGDFTVLFRPNNRGEIVGKYPDDPYAEDPGYGLLLDRNRRLTRIDYPGARATYALKINDRGQIVGAANRDLPQIGGGPGGAGTFGYLLDKGRFRKIAYPGAVSTQAVGVNNRGVVVGEYADREGVFHGYRWENGRFTTFDGRSAPARRSPTSTTAAR